MATRSRTGRGQRSDRSGRKQRAEYAEGQDRRKGRAQLADPDACAAVEEDEHQRDGYDLLDGDEGQPSRGRNQVGRGCACYEEDRRSWYAQQRADPVGQERDRDDTCRHQQHEPERLDVLDHDLEPSRTRQRARLAPGPVERTGSLSTRSQAPVLAPKRALPARAHAAARPR